MKKIIALSYLLIASNSAFAWGYSCTTQRTNEGTKEWCETKVIDENKVTGKKKYIYINFYAFNRQIDPYSVCTKYSQNSLDGRFCLRTAQNMFRDLCHEDKIKYKPFCDAKDKVHPLM